MLDVNVMDVNDFVVVGQSAAAETVVSDQDTAANMGNRRLGDILATPSLVKLMIWAAVDAVDPQLPEGFATVGVAMQFTHTASTVKGATVRVEATIVEIAGNSIIFDIVASDGLGEIGKGHHERTVVVLGEIIKQSYDRVAGMIQTHP